jgi:hypothetical protein
MCLICYITSYNKHFYVLSLQHFGRYKILKLRFRFSTFEVTRIIYFFAGQKLFVLLFSVINWSKKSQDSPMVYRWATGWTTGASSVGRGWEFFSSPPRPDRLWGSPNLLSNGYQRLSTWRQSGRGVKLTTHLHLVPRSRMRGAIPPLPVLLNDVVLS